MNFELDIIGSSIFWTNFFTKSIFLQHHLKGQCHEIFNIFFVFLKDSIWATNKQAKTVSQTFSF